LRENIETNCYYTPTEIQAYTLASMIKANQIIIVGTGLPLVGAVLAKRYLQPSATLIVESGLMDCRPDKLPRSVSDLRSMSCCSVTCPPFRYLGFQANELIHDHSRLIGFIGGAAIDPYGNVSSTCIGNYFKPKLRLPGSGGANGIASFCNTIIVMPHSKKCFVEAIDYITSPGHLKGPDGRAKCGLPANRGPECVISDLGVMKFDENSKYMYLAGYYPFTTPEEIKNSTGFDLDISRAKKLPIPDKDIVRILREEIDPEKIFLE